MRTCLCNDRAPVVLGNEVANMEARHAAVAVARNERRNAAQRSVRAQRREERRSSPNSNGARYRPGVTGQSTTDHSSEDENDNDRAIAHTVYGSFAESSKIGLSVAKMAAAIETDLLITLIKHTLLKPVCTSIIRTVSS